MASFGCSASQELEKFSIRFEFDMPDPVPEFIEHREASKASSRVLVPTKLWPLATSNESYHRLHDPFLIIIPHLDWVLGFVILTQNTIRSFSGGFGDLG